MYKCICSIHSVHKCVRVFVLDRSACPQIFQEFKSTDIKYKTRLRSRISNLKDQKNPDLRRNVLCGNISPHRIASMTAEVRRADILCHCYLLEGFVWVLCVVLWFRFRFRIRLVQGQGRGDVAQHCRRFKHVCVFRWRPKKSFYPRDVLCFGLGWSLFWSHISVVESYWCLAAWSLYREVTTIRKPGGTSEDMFFC